MSPGASRLTPDGPLPYLSTISKSSLLIPQSGQDQMAGTSAHRVPGVMPWSGMPAASSYTNPQILH